MKNRAILFTVILMSIFISCNNLTHNENKNSVRLASQSEIMNYVIDSMLVNYSHYSLCGNFCDFMPDSLFNDFLVQLDTLFTNEDIEQLIEQYDNQKGNEIISYIDTSKFTKIEVLDDYSNYKFYNYHFAISPVHLIKDFGLIYIHAHVDKSGQSDLFALFKLYNGEWKLESTFLYEPLKAYYKNDYHFHDYSFVKQFELDSINILN